MKYRDILGLSKKQPKKKVVKEIKQEPVPSVTDILKEQFGDTKIKVNEGPAYEYAKDVKQIEKTEKLKGKAVNKLVKALEKKGFKKEAKNLSYVYSLYEDKFTSYLDELVDKLI